MGTTLIGHFSLRGPGGVSWCCWASATFKYFCCWILLPPSPFHRCQSQRNSQINILHTPNSVSESAFWWKWTATFYSPGLPCIRDRKNICLSLSNFLLRYNLFALKFRDCTCKVQLVLTNIHSCKPHHHQDTEHFHQPRKFPFVSSRSFPWPPQEATTDLISITVDQLHWFSNLI